MSNINLEPFNTYIEKVRSAARSRSKNVTFSLEEAQELAAAIAQISIKQSELLQQIVDLQKAASNEGIKVEIKSGGFK
jgi:light-regulated signal transduction histidine kinase (bacteriophytochrome)